ncbi:recombination-associated protein RdgC [Candidatus Nitrotoga fabula]|uniref:Recombination-associated protein RdgC n=1 Tax=Candidatus Nitrotoga fabula TaxID=2182327 RepID=A0A916BDV6_9PROT|nr:recombination-associated protein RdgC [Candidatus Nitrotoga fabula]CAE6738499.1 Recombination-associated protein RdgC [Candidatus Nitrotoga fabula]
MWFRNLQVFRITEWDATLAELEAALSMHPLQNCSGLDMQSRGWVAPKAGEGALVHAFGQQMLICLGVEKKLLPASVVSQFARLRAAEMEEQLGYRPGRKQLKEIKERITDELLPRAFVIRCNTCAWIDPVGKWLVVDASNAVKAEELIECLHKTLDGCAFSFLKSRETPVSVMTEWLAGNDVPASFTVDRDCELRDVGNEKSAVRYVRHALDAEEIIHHVRAGKKVTRLAMTWRDKISFILNENLQVKRVVPLDLIKEQTSSRDTGERFDTDFAMMAGEIPLLLADLVDVLGGEEG